MNYEIKNESVSDRMCEDILIKSKDSFSTSEEKYAINARMSPEVFDIKIKSSTVIKKTKYVKEDKENGSK